MIVFTPKSNSSSNSCAGIEEYNNARPPITVHYYGASIALFAIACILWGSSILFFWLLRKSPRFEIVRPFSLSVLLAVSQIMFAVGASLNPVVPDLPCGVLLFMVLLGVAGFGVNIFCRLLVYVVESQFAERTNKYTARIEESDENVSTTSKSTGGLLGLMQASKISAMLSIARLALGLTSIDNVSMEELSRVRRIYHLIALAIFTPATIPALAYLGATVQYQQCIGCAIFFDLLLLCASAVFFYVLCVRIVLVAGKMKLPDKQGVFREMMIITFGAGLPALIGALFVIIDPGDATFNRVFAYEWLTVIPMYVFWWASAGSQFVAAYRDHRRYYSYRTSTSSTSIDRTSLNVDFIQLVLEHEDLHKQFEEYTKSQYASENLYFVLDVMAYKKFFHEKAASWRKFKARVLYDTYIKHEAVMEINISQNTRQKLIENIQGVLGENKDAETSVTYEKASTMFDEAVEDVTNDILRDIWMRFQRDRRQSSLKATLPLRSSSMSRFIPPFPKV